MKSLRLFSVAALMILMFFPLSSQAQRGMGGGGGRGGMGGGGARVSGAMGARGGVVMGARGGVVAGPRGGVVARPSASSATVARFHAVGFRNTGHFRGQFPNNCVAGFPCSPIFFPNCFGFGCRNRFFFNSGFFPFGGFGFGGLGFGGLGFGGWGGYPYYDPFFNENNAQAAPAQQVVSSDNGNTANLELAMEVQRLSDKIDELHAQGPQGSAARPQPQGSISAQAPADSTAFVFRDGHRITTQNFAIVGDTLWVLGEHTAKKVSLANLDKAATEQANAANGIELHLP